MKLYDIRFLLSGIGILLSTSFISPVIPTVTEINQEQITCMEMDSILLPPKPIKRVDKLLYEEFKIEMARLETGSLANPYQVVNRYGYTGKYQFSKTTLRRLAQMGYLKATPAELLNFKQDPELQERAMDALITHNKDILKRYKLNQYVGRTIGGVKITMEGMLAGAHLVGPYAVKHFVTNGGSLSSVKVGGVTVNKYDGNGTSVKDYMKQFEYV